MIHPHHETAFDWYQRSLTVRNRKRQRTAAAAAAATTTTTTTTTNTPPIPKPISSPTTPCEAAQHFVQYGASGLSYIDHAWQHITSMHMQMQQRQREQDEEDSDDDDDEGKEEGDDSSCGTSSGILALEGLPSAGSWTLRTLAAKYVVATRSSSFPVRTDSTFSTSTTNDNDDHDQHHDHDQPDHDLTSDDYPTTSPDSMGGGSSKRKRRKRKMPTPSSSTSLLLPQVLIFDSTGAFLGPTQALALRHVVRSTLLKRLSLMGSKKNPPPTKNTTTTTTNSTNSVVTTTSPVDTTEMDIDEELEECLRRIHIVDAIRHPPLALLECLFWLPSNSHSSSSSSPSLLWMDSDQHHHRSTPSPSLLYPPPTLILWDGMPNDDPDILRQWSRVVRMTTMATIAATTHSRTNFTNQSTLHDDNHSCHNHRRRDHNPTNDKDDDDDDDDENDGNDNNNDWTKVGGNDSSITDRYSHDHHHHHDIYNWVVTTSRATHLQAALQHLPSPPPPTTTTTSAGNNKIIPGCGTTISTTRSNPRIPVHRIRLEHRHGKDCVATVLGKQFFFSASLAGILS